MGFLHEKGEGIELDTSRSEELYRLACEGKFMEGCVDLGRLFWRRDTPIDNSLGTELAQTACDSGSDKGCTMLGMALAMGKGVTQDLDLAQDLWQKSCDNGEEGACNLLNLLHN